MYKIASRNAQRRAFNKCKAQIDQDLEGCLKIYHEKVSSSENLENGSHILLKKDGLDVNDHDGFKRKKSDNTQAAKIVGFIDLSNRIGK